MEKHITLEQAKRLKELGVKQESERTYVENYLTWPPTLISFDNFIKKANKDAVGLSKINGMETYSAFDTTELLQMLPDGYGVNKEAGLYAPCTI